MITFTENFGESRVRGASEHCLYNPLPIRYSLE